MSKKIGYHPIHIPHPGASKEMPTKQAFIPSNKFFVTVIVALSLTIMGSTVVMWYLGSFTKAAVSKGVSEPYRVAYLLNVGPYNDVHDKFEEVAELLRKANIEPETPFLMILDDSNVHEDQRRSKVGYLISKRDYVPGPLETDTLPVRDVLIATFEGSAMMGSYKGYDAMKDWAKRYGYTLSLPAVEFYHPDGKMEYQLGVKKGTN